MLNFKKRKTAALLAFVSMLFNSSISKALEVTKNPGVAKTLTAEKNAVLNSKKKIFVDWVKNHKVLTGGIGTLLLGGLVTASVFLAKHIKNKNKIENNDDKPDNSNSELNALNNEDNGEKNNENNKEKDNESNGSENNTSISSEKNEENDEDNLNNEENKNIQIQIENKKENIINLNTNMKNDNNKNIIIINKKPEENKINENTQIKNLNIEEKNKNIINLENNDKNIMINNGNVDLKVNKKINKTFNNDFKINHPNTINLLHYKSVMLSFNKLRQKISSFKLNANCFASLIGCFNNNYKLESINLQKNNDVRNLKLSYDIHIKTNKTNYQINFEMSGDVVDETKVTVKNMTNKSKKTLNIK